jgi:hypothetical protein
MDYNNLSSYPLPLSDCGTERGTERVLGKYK